MHTTWQWAAASYILLQVVAREAVFVDTVTNSQKEPKLKFYYKMLQYSGVVCSHLEYHTNFPNWEQTGPIISLRQFVYFQFKFWLVLFLGTECVHKCCG